jgi:hypothetical protein
MHHRNYSTGFGRKQMATDFISKSNANLDRAVSESNSFEALREAVKNNLAQSGSGQPTPEVVSEGPKVSAMLACNRVVYPFLNYRFVLTANSESELDEQEQQLKQAFQGQR